MTESPKPADADLRALVERALSSAYEVDREIGRGGMGIVYLARDVRLKRAVAIKLLPPELAFRLEIRSRFLREAETAAQLMHPNIVPIHAVDEREGLVYFVMQYVDGQNLAARLQARGPATVEETRRVLREVAEALAYAHERGVVHRDIKPDNVLIAADTGRAMVTDFGIARAVTEGGDTRLTATGVAIGTPAYMSPEQCAGDPNIDGRSDLYALGVLGYQMLTGKLPFEANTTPALLVKHLSERPRPVEEVRAGVPPDLARAVNLCLEKDPANRFPSARAMVEALDGRAAPAVTGQRVAGGGARGPAPDAPRAGGGAARPGMLPPPPPPPLAFPSPPPTPQSPGAAWGAAAAGTSLAADDAVPSAEEVRRWYSPPVEAYRRKLLPWASVLGVTLFLRLIDVADLTFLPAFWGIYLAFGYARLWSDGYDWRDVLREPRDRLFIDIAEGWADHVVAFFDPRRREALRERHRRDRRLAAAAAGSAAALGGRGSAQAVPPPGVVSGQQAEAARRAAADREEVLRLFSGLSGDVRRGLGDVPATARELAARAEALAASLEVMERDHTPGAGAALDAEIAALEAQANPLDVAASDERVRRLALLRRLRREVHALDERRTLARRRLDDCGISLENLRLDLVRLQAGTGTPQHLTLVAEKAQALARDIDGILAAQAAVEGASGAVRSGR